MQSINPANGEVVRTYSPHSMVDIAQKIDQAHECFLGWRDKSFLQRAALFHRAAALLRERKAELTLLMAEEMGKVMKEGEAEIEKCASACEYYADNAEKLLADEAIKTEAHNSFITYQPLGVILAIMPWNFPFWQVFRFAAPHLMAGNVGVLKHASNVCGCALAIETIFRDAGFPKGCMTTLLVPGDAVEQLVTHKCIRAVTLTGSAAAGRAVAAKAGQMLKKTVLELGGSDPYVVLADADLISAASECAKSRLINTGQSCIAAKRFIVVASAKAEFERHLVDQFKAVRMGSPQESGMDIGPLARTDLRDELHKQVTESVKKGAKLLLGGVMPEGHGAFYPPTLLTDVRPGMPAFDEELFGPAAAIIEAKDEEDAIRLANASSFGLGAAIFTADRAHGTALARTRLEAGQVFVNAFVRSDQRLPFGGIKESGYGRELTAAGIREFVNIKTVYAA